MPDFQGGFGNIGGAVQDLFEAGGHKKAAASYGRAALMADLAGNQSEASGKIKVAQTMREAYRVIGGQQADVAGAGFASTGTALDLLRSSTADANMAIGLTQAQASIDTNDFRSQAQAYRDKAAQEKSAAKGSIFGAILKGVAAVASFVI